MVSGGESGMKTPPSWLPPMVCVNPWTVETFETLYEVFKRDFKATQPAYAGQPVWTFSDMDSGREVVFWHLTHRQDKVTGGRLPDLRRSERLPWVRKMIDNAKKPEILAWDYKEGKGTVNTYIWLKDYDFLVLMKKYPDGRRRLLTSFYVDYPNYRRKLEKKYFKRIK
jgi:hypothetical protein